MKFPYAVKYNGKFYPPNTEIKEVKPVVKEKPVRSPKKTTKDDEE